MVKDINGIRVPRYREVFRQKYGRPPLPGCVPHHINGDEHDDTPDNLIELTKQEHMYVHRQAKKNKIHIRDATLQFLKTKEELTDGGRDKLPASFFGKRKKFKFSKFYDVMET